MASDSVVFYNLLPHMVEHWACVHEFNGMLVRWLNYKKMDKRVKNRILNLCAAPFQCNSRDKVESQFRKNNSITTGNNLENNWVASGRVFRHYRSGVNDILSRFKNMRNVLAELVEEEMNYNESKKEEIDENEVNKKEIETLQQSLECAKESCNIEAMTADVLEKFSHELDNDYAKTKKECEKLKCEIAIKNKKRK